MTGTPDPLIEVIAHATARHYLDPNWTDADGHSRCICGGWAEGEMEPGWDDHMAEVAYDAIAATGRLLPEGGKTRVDHGVMWPSGRIGRCANVTEAAAKILAREEWRNGDERVGGPGLYVRRTVVTWPPVSRANAGRYAGPWEVAQ